MAQLIINKEFIDTVQKLKTILPDMKYLTAILTKKYGTGASPDHSVSKTTTTKTEPTPATPENPKPEPKKTVTVKEEKKPMPQLKLKDTMAKVKSAE